MNYQKYQKGLIILVSMVTQIGLYAQIVPDAPVIDFKLPMFGENGYKIWDLQGDEGRYINTERIDVINLKLRVFSGDSSLLLDTTIESPEATMLIRSNRALSNSSIRMVGPNYHITGMIWHWEGSKRTLVVKKNVRVKFQDTLTDILK